MQHKVRQLVLQQLLLPMPTELPCLLRQLLLDLPPTVLVSLLDLPLNRPLCKPESQPVLP